PRSYSYGMILGFIFGMLMHSGFLPGSGNTAALTSNDSLFIKVLNYEQLKPLLHENNDTTYVISFWATWCTPCMEELPYFLQLDSVYAMKPLKLVMVSLDFKKDYIRRLQPFVREKKLEDRVVVLEDNNANYWINDIDPNWSGAIPATLVYKGEQRSFYQRTFRHVDELKAIVKPYLNL
ncbi:MAG TPA: TlpA disulfide reductase family protein, partial [Saprospiraceae bacterium]|nr:TlpA disulfide reductase family protein [Saprospiraceae bacterium]